MDKEAFMPNVTKLININSQHNMPGLGQERLAPCSGYPYIKAVNNIENIHIKDKNDIANINARCNARRYDEQAADVHEKKIDDLFYCVNELRNNPECLSQPGNTKFIAIELMSRKKFIPTKHILLPSGRSIHAGYHEGRLIVSDGSNYHVEQDWQPTTTWKATLANLLAHLTGGYGRPDEKRSRGWLQTAYNWFNTMGDPFIFPQADGKPSPPDNNNSGDVIYAAQAEFAVQFGPADAMPSTGETSGPNTLSTPVTLALASLPGAGKPLGAAVIPSQLIFTIDGHEFKIAPANLEAEAQLQSLIHDFLQQKTLPVDNPLATLIEFDSFIGREMAVMFHRGLYLKEKKESLNIIIFKMLSENILSTMGILAQKETAIANNISEYSGYQIKISQYITDLEQKVLDGTRRVDNKIIKDLVSYIRNKDLSTAKQGIIQNIEHAEFDNRIYHKKLLHYFLLFDQAFDEYRQQMNLDDFPALEKNLYINSQQIFNALIDGSNECLTDSLIKLKFLYIFEYTRSNGISIFSSNFIIPGEMSNLWHGFAEDEIEFNKEEVDKAFAEELVSFIYQHKPSHNHLDQALDLIDISKLDEAESHDNGTWVENNLRHFHHAHDILSKIIENNQFEQEKILEHVSWYNDYVNRLHNDKTIYIFMAYLINLQILFIDEVADFHANNRHIIATSQEQRIVAAKIEAVRSKTLEVAQEKDDYGLLVEYHELESKGHLDLLIKAAVSWYMSQQYEVDEDFLKSLNVLYILKRFITAQQQVLHEQQARQQQSFTSLFQLKPSSKMDTAEGYYQQFRYYKIHDSFFEAQRFSILALDNSTLNYLDIIYPPKEIFCFKVFSRNYVTNHLSAFTNVYLPAENLGYLSIAKLHSDRHVLISTLNGFPFVADIDTPEKIDIMHQMKTYWAQCNTFFALRNRPQHPINETTLASLFPKIDANSHRLTSMIDILLLPPEEESIGLAAPAYGLVAVKNNDIDLIISPYASQQQTTYLPLSTDTPLITNFDYLNQATLITITNELKETLYESTWLEYVAAFIPFFTTLCRHWHDEEHEIKFEEVIFDIYDLMLSLVFFAGKFKKISENTLKHALHKAIEQKIPHNAFKRFIINELIIASPELGLKYAKSTLNEFSSYFNVIHPSGRSLSIFVEKLQVNVLEIIAKANRAIQSDSLRKKILRRPWKSNVNEKIVETLNTGVSIINSTAAESYYVTNDNEYFPVFWDKYHGEWRIINSHGPDNKNFAIPVARSHSGNWVASAGQLVDLKFSPFSFSPMYYNQHDNANIITIEPMRTSAYQDFSDNNLITFHKAILHFYLQRHYYSQRIIGGKVDVNLFLDQSYRSFSIKQEILAMHEFNGFAYDITSQLQALKTLKSYDDSRIRFRAVCGWRGRDDQMAGTYFALSIRLKNRVYILDLNEIRANFGFEDKRDVFTENEWIMMMNNFPSQFELIKFKDFEFIIDAKYFNYREATTPFAYIKYGFLLKEPEWYRPSVIRASTDLKKAYFPQKMTSNPNIHLVARALRSHIDNYKMHEEYIIYCLFQSELVDNAGARKLLHLINQAKSDGLASRAVLSNQQRIYATSDLLKINKGKIIAALNYLNQLEYLLLSLGQGRFIGMSNDYLSLITPARAMLIIAEQLGTFKYGVLKPHYADTAFSVFAGDAFGAKDDTPVLLDGVFREKIPEYFIDGRIKSYREQDIPRERVLLGKDCQITRNDGDSPHLSIKSHGTPFLVNHMDVIEFADTLKGLTYVDNGRFDLHNITGIDLISCFSGYGRRYSNAQLLANELGIKVYTAPPYVSDGVRLRRPEWFREYDPQDVISPMGNQNQLPHRPRHQEHINMQNMQRAIHELMHAVRDVIRRLAYKGHNQNVEDSPFQGLSRHVPFIYIDILQLLFPHNPHHPLIVGDITLCSESQTLLMEIIADYAIDAGKENYIIEQAFLDVILSIDEYKYLSNQFNATSIEG
ncbi:hypothetical protein [Acerihabitans sp.]|uniref:hypothetical protein n=1 Tax=Acerihabitans sp. TaxID=2811394 RepID=UPI002ED902C4